MLGTVQGTGGSWVAGAGKLEGDPEEAVTQEGTVGASGTSEAFLQDLNRSLGMEEFWPN